jgi:hypothetical protein
MSFSLLLAVLAVLATWIALLLMLGGIGVGWQRVFGAPQITGVNVLLSPWNGLALVILFLQVWHFLFAIRWPALVVCGIWGAAGLFVSRQELSQWLSKLRIGWKLCAILAVVAIWIANRAIGPGNAFDSGLYHYQVVRWSHEYPIVPGLANLHPMFALNNSCHLFDAMLQFGPWEGRGNHLGNSLLLWIAMSTAIISVAALVKGLPDKAQNLFNLILLVPLVMYAVSKESSNPTTDLPQSMVAFAAASTFVRALHRIDDDSSDAAFATTSVVLLAAAALCIKLSAAAMAVPLGICALGIYCARAKAPGRRGSVIGWSVGLSCGLACTWLARGVVLSGCPFYPSRFLALPVEWRIPPEAAGGLSAGFRADSEQVRISMLHRAVASPAFARLPGWIGGPIQSAAQNATGRSAWFLAMLLASTVEVAMPAAIALGAFVALVIHAGRSARQWRISAQWLAAAPPLIGLTFWACTAPEPRYAASALWILAAVLSGLLFQTTSRLKTVIATVVILSSFPIFYRMLAQKLNPAGEPILNALFIPAGPDHGLHPIPTVVLNPYKTFWGLTILVPADFNPCWYSPLPSTSAPNPALRLRVPDDLESGFILDLKTGMKVFI